MYLQKTNENQNQFSEFFQKNLSLISSENFPFAYKLQSSLILNQSILLLQQKNIVQQISSSNSYYYRLAVASPILSLSSFPCSNHLCFLFLSEDSCWLSQDSFQIAPTKQLQWRSAPGELAQRDGWVLVAQGQKGVDVYQIAEDAQLKY